MTMRDQPVHPAAPAVVPRWEWRTFGGLDDADPAAAALGTAATVESDETYVLSRYADASVKVRAGLLDVKVLKRVNAAGLELWVPAFKAAFPLDHEAVEAAFTALGVPVPATRRTASTWEALLDDVAGRGEDLHVVDTHKRRHRSVLDDCMVELTDVSVGGSSIRTVAVESPDPQLVTATVRRLGLDGRPNVCVPRGLRTLLGWGPTRFAVLDVGTNSVKFIQGERQPGGRSHTTADTAVVTRLGEGLAQTGELTQVAILRTVDAIAELVDAARRIGPLDIVAVGTAGLRMAPNRDAFVDAVHARCGVAVEVISGQEEARLAYRAAVSALPRTGDRLLVFDSGGGSSQFTFGSRDRIEEQFSLDVGAVRLHRTLRARRRRTPRDRRRRSCGDRCRPLTPGGPRTPGQRDRDRRDRHEPGSGRARPAELRPRHRPRHRRGRGRGRATDRDVPTPARRRTTPDRRTAAGACRSDPRGRLHRPHDPHADRTGRRDRQRPRPEARCRRREVRHLGGCRPGGGEQIQRRTGLRLLRGGQVHPLCGEERLGLRSRRERLLGGALGGELEDLGPVGVEPQLGDQRARVALRVELELEDVERSEDLEIVERQPIGSVVVEQCPLLPWRTAAGPACGRGTPWRAPRRPPLPSSGPNRRNPRASRRPPRRTRGRRRCSSASSEGTTGRSLTTESPALRWTRRARTTMPAWFSRRSGVSK